MMARLELLDGFLSVGIKSAVNWHFETLFVQEHLQLSDRSRLIPAICRTQIRWASVGSSIGQGTDLSRGSCRGRGLSERSSRRQSEERESRQHSKADNTNK